MAEEKTQTIKKILPVTVASEADLPSVVIAELEDGGFTTFPAVWEKLSENEYKGTVEGSELSAEASVGAAETKEEAPAKEEETPVEECRYFPLSKVRLLPGKELYTFQQDMNEYLLSLNADSLLYNFRAASGLDTKGAEPMTGWDAPSCNLKGHTTGHYLSGLALAYAATGDGRFKKKVDYMVQELTRVRDAFKRSGKTAPGYLGAYDETQFDLLEKFTKYPEIWAPYYTLEKIMSGLYDCTVYGGNRDALKLLRGLGDWVHDRLSKTTKEQRDKMWSMYIAGEFGGMISVLAKLSVLAKDEKYLETAKFFWNDKLFYPMSQNVDTLDGVHANQHIPQILGLVELWKATGEKKYYDIAKNFQEMVTAHHSYCFGGVGEEEKFTAPDSETAHLSEKSAESCPSYNLNRVLAALYPYSMDTSLMDTYENILYNHLVSSADKGPTGCTTYFMPTAPGSKKVFEPEENHCCHGTGMESRYRFMENIFSEDDENYYVNLIADARLEGLLEVTTEEKGKSLKVRVKALSNLKKNVCVRVPSWGIGGGKSTPGSRFASGKLSSANQLSVLTPTQQLYQMNLKKGEELQFSFQNNLRAVKSSDRTLISYAKGLHLMALRDDRTELILNEEAKEKLVPFNEIGTESYHLYFMRELPKEAEIPNIEELMKKAAEAQKAAEEKKAEEPKAAEEEKKAAEEQKTEEPKSEEE